MLRPCVPLTTLALCAYRTGDCTARFICRWQSILNQFNLTGRPASSHFSCINIECNNRVRKKFENVSNIIDRASDIVIQSQQCQQTNSRSLILTNFLYFDPSFLEGDKPSSAFVIFMTSMIYEPL